MIVQLGVLTEENRDKLKDKYNAAKRKANTVIENSWRLHYLGWKKSWQFNENKEMSWVLS